MLAITVIILSVFVRRFKKRSTIFFQELIRMEAEKQYLAELYEKYLIGQEQKELEKTDGFLKFVSDSRDWAFAYIEDVQGKLAVFDNDLTEILDYYSLYEPDAQGIHVDILKQVSEAYENLKGALPKEGGKV